MRYLLWGLVTLIINVIAFAQNEPEVFTDPATGHVVNGLKLEPSHLSFGNVSTEKEVSKEVQILNTGTRPVKISEDSVDTPYFIRMEFDTFVVSPGKSTKVVVTIQPEKAGFLGYNEQQIRFYSYEGGGWVENDLFVISTIREFFSPIEEGALQQKPKITFDASQFDFGSVNPGDQLQTTFLIYNTGDALLNIRDVQPNCGCVTWELDTFEVQPGDSTVLRLTFDTTSRRGNQYKSVTIFSNDPTASAQMLTIKAQVTSK